MAEFKADFSIVDINSMGYACMYVPALSRLQHHGEPTGGLYGAINSVLTHMSQRPEVVPFVVWDSKAQWRYDLYAEYKGTRTNNEEKLAIRESYRKQTPMIRMMLGALGIPQISCGGCEADDLAGMICRSIDPSWNIELRTKDTDWFQGLKNNIVWSSTGSNKVIDLAWLTNPDNDMDDGHFVSVREYLQCKALAGDSSDNIAGVDKVGLKTAAKKLREHGGSVETFWNEVDSGSYTPKGVIEERLASAETRALFERNIKLMDWELAPAPRLEYMAVMAGKPNWDDARAIADEWGLNKIMKQAKDILSPWEKSGWGEALLAVDCALHADWCQTIKNSKKMAFC